MLAVVGPELGVGPYLISDLLYEEFFCQLELVVVVVVSHEEFVCQLEPALALALAVGDPE